MHNVKDIEKNWQQSLVEINFTIENNEDKLTVFTTRPDTIYGVTFVILAPEHPIIDKLQTQIKNIEQIRKYQAATLKKSKIERSEIGKGITGVKLEGIKAINPLNDKPTEIWIADYVMMDCGTGATMAVPAHNQREYDFAKKFNIPIIQVIAPCFIATGDSAPKEGAKNTKRKLVSVILKHHTEEKYLILDWKKYGWETFINGGIEGDETIEETAIREVKEETGYQNIIIDNVSNFYFCDNFYAPHKDVNREIIEYTVYAHIKDDTTKEVEAAELQNHVPVWLDKDKVLNVVNKPNKECLEWIFNEEKAWLKDGIMINSGILNGINNKKEAITKTIMYLEEKGLGKKIINECLQD